MEFRITETRWDDINGWPIYNLEREGQETLMATYDKLWEVIAAEIKEGDTLREEHASGKVYTLTYEQVQETVRENATFDAE